MLIAGADGCPGGWAVVTAQVLAPEATIGSLTTEVVDGLDRFVAMTRRLELAALAIDMPIALLDRHPRNADLEARRFLGPRRASVFPTPVLATLDAVDYADACARSRASCGKALSKQAWNLMPKIRQLDHLIEAEDQSCVVEAHPECAFQRLNDGRPLDQPKSTAAGQRVRSALLTSSDRFAPGEIQAALDRRTETRPIVPITDLLDALSLVLTAHHVAIGSEHRLGDQRDHRGRRAQIVF